MAKRDLIAIGASAGSIEVLRALIHRLPGDLGAAIVLAVHLAPTKRSELAHLLRLSGSLDAVTASDGMRLEPGRIHVAPPNLHLTIEGDRLRTDSGPRENGFRPAIDRLFRSVARERGPRAIGVILSGMRDDGTDGLAVMKRCGALAIVQDPASAAFSSMPESAINRVAVDHIVRVEEMADLLVASLNEPDDEERARSRARTAVSSRRP